MYVLSAIGVYVLVLGLSLLIVVVLLVRLPATYFLDREDRQLWVDHHPVARLALASAEKHRRRRRRGARFACSPCRESRAKGC